MKTECWNNYRLEVHSYALCGRFRYAVDRLDGRQLVNIGWFTSYKNAKAAMYRDAEYQHREDES